VVYCQHLSEGRFGVGLQFEVQAASWPKKPLTEVD
jgi:hypothetical protein